ncbi:MAG: hypothetical protein INR70_23515 [Parafilimonas terrae]|nr:hypothetical protein [Parafilimonas terrae]
MKAMSMRLPMRPTLHFSMLKPGDRVQVRAAENAGQVKVVGRRMLQLRPSGRWSASRLSSGGRVWCRPAHCLNRGHRRGPGGAARLSIRH